MAYRIAIDTGGTFTDLVLADERGGLVLGKSLTTYERIFGGLEVNSRTSYAVRDFFLNGGAQAVSFTMLVPEIQNPPDRNAAIWVFELPSR